MAAYKFTHRATALPGGDPETDRVVVCDGRTVGRVMQIDAGQQAGLWQWSGFWIGSDTRGTVETLAEGLEAIKSRVDADALDALPP